MFNVLIYLSLCCLSIYKSEFDKAIFFIAISGIFLELNKIKGKL